MDVPEGPVVVCGGGEVGGETAHFITETCHDITLLEMQDDILNDMMPLSRDCLVRYIHGTGVKVVTKAKVARITDHSVLYIDENGNEVELPADTVISAFGYKSYNPLEETARKYCADVKVIGGAVKAGNALTAVKEGYEAALAL